MTSLAIEATGMRKTFGVLGPNGAGKTTTIRMPGCMGIFRSPWRRAG